MSRQSEKKLEEDIAQHVIGSISNEKLINAYNFLTDFMIYRKIIKLKDTYIEGVKEALSLSNTGKIYMDYNLDGAVTGRLSCKGSDTQNGALGVSLHTLPRENEI